MGAETPPHTEQRGNDIYMHTIIRTYMSTYRNIDTIHFHLSLGTNIIITTNITITVIIIITGIIITISVTIIIINTIINIIIIPACR